MTGTPVTVVGFLSLDEIICPAGRFENVPGGAAYYCAAAAAAAGARVRLVAKVGSDFPAEALRDLQRLNVDLSGLVPIASPSRRSRLHDASGRNRVLAHVAEASWWDAIARFEPPIPAGNGIFVYTAMPPAVLRQQMAARHRDDRIVVDTSPAYAGTFGPDLRDLVPRMSCFAPSREETRQLFPTLDDDRSLAELSRQAPLVLQKRGPDGLMLKRRGGSALFQATMAVSVLDTTGAGDSVVGALAAAMAAGADDEVLLRQCARIAAMTVSDIGINGLLSQVRGGADP